MTRSPAPFPPTARQMQLLHLLAKAEAEAKPVPSYWELARDLDLAQSGVHRLMSGLQERGWIERRKGRARCVRILHPVPGTITLDSAFRAGHQAGACGWPLEGALTAWRKASFPAAASSGEATGAKTPHTQERGS